MDPLSSSLNDLRRAKFSARCSSFEGLEAIHAEWPRIFHVRITNISCDTWGVKAVATDLLAPGMHRPRRSPFELGCIWSAFSFHAEHWQAHYVAWRIFFDREVVRRCVALGAQADGKGSTIDWDYGRLIFADYDRRVVDIRE